MSLFDPAATKKFLELYKPGGPWVLTRISTDRQRLDTKAFTSHEAVKRWLIKYNQSEKDNVYFSVNEPVDGLPFDRIKKLGREHISRMTFLHVDLDPQIGKSLELERKRILAVLRDPPKGVPQATFIIFSGGGYQAFWRLTEAFDIHGDEALFEQAKLYNLALEQAFDADSCHNVDRIMRLPGTTNWPTDRKAKLGRKPALAELIEHHDDAVYPLCSFQAAAPVKAAEKAGDDVAIDPDAVKRLADVNELGDKVKDTVKALIVQGANAETSTGTVYESDSEAVWYVCCELLRYFETRTQATEHAQVRHPSDHPRSRDGRGPGLAPHER
jgi:hypothetical protein